MQSSHRVYVFFLNLFAILCFSHHPVLADSVQIFDFITYDQGEVVTGGSGTLSIDSIQDDCDPSDEEEDLELFFDTTLGIKVRNEVNREFRFRRARMRLRYQDNGVTKRVRFRSGIITNFIANADDETEVLVFLLNARDGRKYIPGKDIVLPEDAGFVSGSVRFLKGRSEDGRKVKLRGRFTRSIGNVDRCS